MPTDETLRSCVRLPNAVDRVVYPDPPAVTEDADAPALNNRSFALVVVTDPLFIPTLVPIAAVCTSSGFVLSTPEYSWT